MALLTRAPSGSATVPLTDASSAAQARPIATDIISTSVNTLSRHNLPIISALLIKPHPLRTAVFLAACANPIDMKSLREEGV
jgi:hypothetical protein